MNGVNTGPCQTVQPRPTIPVAIQTLAGVAMRCAMPHAACCFASAVAIVAGARPLQSHRSYQ